MNTTEEMLKTHPELICLQLAVNHYVATNEDMGTVMMLQSEDETEIKVVVPVNTMNVVDMEDFLKLKQKVLGLNGKATIERSDIVSDDERMVIYLFIVKTQEIEEVTAKLVEYGSKYGRPYYAVMGYILYNNVMRNEVLFPVKYNGKLTERDYAYFLEEYSTLTVGDRNEKIKSQFTGLEDVYDPLIVAIYDFVSGYYQLMQNDHDIVSVGTLYDQNDMDRSIALYSVYLNFMIVYYPQEYATLFGDHYMYA
jgi:hypothetical protein